MRPLALGLVTICVLGFSSIAQIQAQAQEPMEPSGVAQVLMSNDPKDFYQSAGSANLFEIRASKLAQTRAQSPEIRKFADMMVADHTEASQKLEALAGRKGVALPTQLLRRHQMMLDGLMEEKAGKDFDDHYSNKMVVSHKEAVSLFEQASRESKDPDIRSFAAEILPTLQRHGGLANDLEAGVDQQGRR